MSCAAGATALIANKAKEITRLNSVYNSLLKNAGVDYIEGKGSLVDAHTVKVGPATGTTSSSNTTYYWAAESVPWTSIHKQLHCMQSSMPTIWQG